MDRVLDPWIETPAPVSGHPRPRSILNPWNEEEDVH
jgi:hypothetical protein